MLVSIEIFAVIIILVLILVATNYAFLSSKDGDGKIVRKQFIAEHNETTSEYDVVLKMTIPVIHHYEDEWKVSICVDDLTNNISKDDLTDTLSVTEEYYNDTSIGSIVKVKYTKGRIWKSLNIQKIY